MSRNQVYKYAGKEKRKTETAHEYLMSLNAKWGMQHLTIKATLDNS